jgi:hypothetical protein
MGARRTRLAQEPEPVCKKNNSTPLGRPPAIGWLPVTAASRAEKSIHLCWLTHRLNFRKT